MLPDIFTMTRAQLDELAKNLMEMCGIPEDEVMHVINRTLDSEKGAEVPLDPNRGVTWQMEDGWTGYRPSAIGSCIRGLVASRLNMAPEPPTEEELTVMNEGHLHEPFVARWWQEKMGGRVVRHKMVRVDVPEVKARAAGTCDGIWYPERGKTDEKWFKTPKALKALDMGLPVIYGLEIKAQGKASHSWTDQYGPEEGYKWQEATYHWGIEETFNLYLAGFAWVYKNRDNGQIKHLMLEDAYFSRDDVAGRIIFGETLASLGREGFEGVECDREDFFCDWWHLHPYDRRGLEYDERFEPLAEMYDELKEKYEAMKARATEIREAMHRALRYNHQTKARTTYHSICEISMKPTLNETAAIECDEEYKHLKRQLQLRAEELMNSDPRFKRPGTKYVKVIPLKALKEKRAMLALAGDSGEEL